MEAVADPKVLRLATMCLPDEVCGGPLFRSTTLFFNPEGDPATNNREGDWHSDAQFVIPDEADEKQFLEEEAASGIGQTTHSTHTAHTIHNTQHTTRSAQHTHTQHTQAQPPIGGGSA
jgi:hypothetical protein